MEVVLDTGPQRPGKKLVMSPKDATFFLSEGGFVDLEDDVGKITSRCRTTYLCKRKTKIKTAETP